LILTSTACQPDGKGAYWGGRQPAESPPPATASDASLDRIEIRFDVLRVQLPLGTVSASETMWNHVDEDVLGFEEARQLGQNGFRAGLASVGSWMPIKAIIETATGAVTLSNSVQTQELSPIEVQLKEVPEPLTMFHYRKDSTLAGATYPAGMLQLRIEPVISPDLLPEVTVRVTPELYAEPSAVRWQVTPAGPRQTPVRRGKSFDELALSLPIPPGRFLVIGPSGRVSDPQLVGSACLTDEVNGELREWVIFVTPAVVRAGESR
jgi:hypothetical protein